MDGGGQVGSGFDPESWRAHGYSVAVRWRGRPCRALTIGAFADAVGRSPVTVRLWERSGVIPPCPWVLDRANQQARRRVWPETVLHDVRRAALDERVCDGAAPTGRFTQRVAVLYEAATRPLPD
ncbi:hypothetical protein acdb102_16070 [Acidothermaceae bacterium B102]|nr:hypothetical protein acdb102_16070 [Acidothermaceae bacterium B102]